MTRAARAADEDARRTSAREICLSVLAGAVAAIVMTWPFILGMADEIAVDPNYLGDPLLQTWEIAWGGHALLHGPLGFFDANAYWPLERSLAFSDSLAGYAPLALFGSGSEAALIRYNVLFVLTYTLAFVGAYLLARELGVRPAAAAVCGLAFAYAPWRLAHAPHLNILSSGGIALALFFLLRGYRRRRPGAILAGWLVAAWQVSLGWNLGLPFLYALAALALVATAVWVRSGRAALGRSVVAASIAGVAVLAAVSGLLAVPYFEVLHDHPESRRTIADLEVFSPPIRGLVSAPEQNALWGPVTRPIRNDLRRPLEQSLFPGALTVLLAGVGLVSSGFSQRLRLGLGGTALLAAIFSLGLQIGGGRFTYVLLYDYLPGWQGLRTPGRLAVFTALALALLVALGADALLARVRAGQRRIVPIVAALTLGVLVLAEGYGSLVRNDVPPPPGELQGLRPPLLQLPLGLDYNDHLAMYWSTRDFPSLVNGSSGVRPLSYTRLEHALMRFPDPATVELVRDLGIQTVVLYRELAPGTFWQDAAERPVAGLPLERREAGSFVLFTIELGPAT